MKAIFKAISIILTIIGVLLIAFFSFVGMDSLSGATEGVGIISFACAAGIAIRIIQAELHHHSRTKNKLTSPLVNLEKSDDFSK